MKKEEQQEALQNAMESFNFPKKYFVYAVNTGRNTKFTLASKSKEGGLNTHTPFVPYNEFNSYLKGWYDAKMNKF